MKTMLRFGLLSLLAVMFTFAVDTGFAGNHKKDWDDDDRPGAHGRENAKNAKDKDRDDKDWDDDDKDELKRDVADALVDEVFD